MGTSNAKAAAVTAIATLIGAGLGVAGTLLVSERQGRAGLEAEERARRVEVYTAYHG